MSYLKKVVGSLRQVLGMEQGMSEEDLKSHVSDFVIKNVSLSVYSAIEKRPPVEGAYLYLVMAEAQGAAEELQRQYDAYLAGEIPHLDKGLEAPAVAVYRDPGSALWRLVMGHKQGVGERLQGDYTNYNRFRDPAVGTMLLGEGVQGAQRVLDANDDIAFFWCYGDERKVETKQPTLLTKE
ncbi:MAG: hypothetical protein WAZ18_01100 [Alphaproteobacteria bacterium]